MLLLQKSLHEWEKSQHEKGCKIILRILIVGSLKAMTQQTDNDRKCIVRST